MAREKYKKQYNSEQKEWIRNNAHNYKTIADITKAFNEEFKTAEATHTIRSRVQVLFGDEVRRWNEHDRMNYKFVNIAELREKAKSVKPNGMKWVKNYPHYALYEITYPSGDKIRSCFNYIELRWFS